MRIALFSWETLHSIAVGGVGRPRHRTGRRPAAPRPRGPRLHPPGATASRTTTASTASTTTAARFPLNPNFVDEINNMCRAFVHDFFAVEDHVGRFDIVHAHDWLASNAAVWIKEGRGRKAVLTMHSTEYGRNGNRFFGGQSHARPGPRAARHLLRRPGHHRLQPAQGRDQAGSTRCPTTRRQVIYNGVNAARLRLRRRCRRGQAPLRHRAARPDRAVRRPHGGAEGAGHPGADHAVACCATTRNAKFVFAGDGHMQQRGLRAWPTSWASAHALRMLGDRRGRELHDLFKACDIVAVPSRNEPFGIVILEGWSAYKPVVSTKRGGPAEFVWHGVNGLQVDDTPDSVAWGLGTLLADHNRCRWMGRNGRAAVDAAFSWDSIAEQTEEVYASVA